MNPSAGSSRPCPWKWLLLRCASSSSTSSPIFKTLLPPATPKRSKVSSDGPFHCLLTSILEALEQLEQLLDVVGSFGEELPAACQNTAAETWAVMDDVIHRYGDMPEICDRATRALRLGLQFFDRTALPLVPAILARLTSRFENTGFASYLWSIGKVIQRFGSEEDMVIRSAMQQTYERCTAKCWEIFSQSAITLHSDGMS